MSKRQETPIKKNAFVHKLYSMLNDPELTNLIWWTRDEDSNTFALSPGKEFANALTRYFKHGNVASFVRQLHMYGFHKVSDPSHTNTTVATDAELPVWEFKHSSGKFKKNDESSLVYIKRRSSSNNSRNVYNNENDANIVIPTSTPSPEHVQYLQEGNHYMPQGYYFYNGHQVAHHLSPHMSFAPGGPAPLHQPNHPQMFYTQKSIPSSVPQAYSQENMMEKQNFDIQRSISPQSQPPSQQIPQVPKPQPISHLSQPPLSQPQLQPPLQDTTKQSQQSDSQDSQQPQHYTPNLQFRKIWENDNLHSRPRNPSLLFDPLAPVPVTSQLQPVHQSQNAEQQQQPQSSFSYLMSRSDSRSSYASARESITSTRDSFVSNRDSIASGRESLASAKDSISSTKDSFSSVRDSFGTPRDSFTLSKDPDNRLSIKLPPPSSIHNPSFYSNYSNSPYSSVSDTSHASTLTSSNLPKAPSNESPSSSTSTSTIKVKSNSIPETSTATKRPSIFPSHSVHEKLRPSLIELHFGSSNKGSILNPQNDSIGSQSSHNSIFSNNSSLSSTSSFHRTSSFGSISHHPIFANKNSISIAPHEVLPNTLLARSRTSNSEQEANSDSRDSTPALKAPKVLHINSPIKRSSTTAIPTSSGAQIALKIRSLNSSPLSRLITNDDLMAIDSNPKSSNTKVSIHSLLDDDQGEGKILLPSKSNIKAGLREVKEVITELNEEKDTNEENDSQNPDDNNQHSKSLVDLKRQKLD